MHGVGGTPTPSPSPYPIPSVWYAWVREGPNYYTTDRSACQEENQRNFKQK
jgi:hypothetical protein